MRATAYVAHPYQFPVIGWPSDIEGWTGADLAAYFKTYYAPNNCVIVFSGDVTAAEVFAFNVSLPDFSRFVLPNGAVIILAEKADVPLVGLQLLVRGGAASDPSDGSSAASLLAALMEKGAGNRDAAAFASAVDSVGGRLSATAGMAAITIQG